MPGSNLSKAYFDASLQDLALLMLSALTGRVANRHSSQNADISLPAFLGESTLQRFGMA